MDNSSDHATGVGEQWEEIVLTAALILCWEEYDRNASYSLEQAEARVDVDPEEYIDVVKYHSHARAGIEAAGRGQWDAPVEWQVFLDFLENTAYQHGDDPSIRVEHGLLGLGNAAWIVLRMAHGIVRERTGLLEEVRCI